MSTHLDHSEALVILPDGRRFFVDAVPDPKDHHMHDHTPLVGQVLCGLAFDWGCLKHWGFAWEMRQVMDP
jgi:hypothetical protein